MVGHVDPQRNLYTCDNQYLKWCLCGTLRIVGEDTFYGFLARHRPELFRDDDFVSLYTQNNGRTSVPPSILAKALLSELTKLSEAKSAAVRKISGLQSSVTKADQALGVRPKSLDKCPVIC